MRVRALSTARGRPDDSGGEAVASRSTVRSAFRPESASAEREPADTKTMSHVAAAPPTPPDVLSPELELDAILEQGTIASVYQPIVELSSGSVVGYEALARGPQDSPLHTPGALFGTAVRAGRLEALDWACRAAALRGALGTAIERPSALFVNIEPVAAMASIPTQFDEVVADARERLQVVFEFTERALTDRPAEVLQAVEQLRRLGAMIALDDVGVDPRSLALMPFLRPDVIKLDMSVVQGRASLRMARTMHAVNAQADAFGAIVLAEGIETPEHLQRALALGATHGQGWMYGRPAPAPSLRPVGTTFPMARRSHAPGSEPTQDVTPFEQIAAADERSRVATKQLLLALSRQLELQAEDLGPEAVVITNLQAERHLTAATRERYRRLAERTAFVGVVGEHISGEPVAGVRGGALAPSDPMAQEWNVFVISPHFTAAMVARDLGDDGDDMARRFEYRLVYDRSAAVSAARLLMAKIAPQH
ncbi:MAG: EAL domain-containing protein [Solirubrobacteraceae bacterium]|nr:EAL domain-containing protein [Solirubrobacteraceae bacterium]